MNSHQLKCATDCDVELRRNILGIFAADQLPQKIPNEPFGLIVNIDPHYKPGRHWIALYVQRGEVEAFDSYGNLPSHYSLYIERFLQRFTKVVFNTKKLQSSYTKVCGQYCLFYLMCRCRGYSMMDITGIFSNDFKLNDEFVYYFVDERFHCCMHDELGLCQISTCINKV